MAIARALACDPKLVVGAAEDHHARVEVHTLMKHLPFVPQLSDIVVPGAHKSVSSDLTCRRCRSVHPRRAVIRVIRRLLLTESYLAARAVAS